jgi:hypothetical protein
MKSQEYRGITDFENYCNESTKHEKGRKKISLGCAAAHAPLSPNDHLSNASLKSHASQS